MLGDPPSSLYNLPFLLALLGRPGFCFLRGVRLEAPLRLMVAHTPCSECGTANRNGLLFCVVCGRRLARVAFAPDRITALAWPGPELLLAAPARPSTLAVASFVAGVLAWSILPVLGAALAVLLALRAHEEQAGAHRAASGVVLIRFALWLGGVQLALALLAGTAMAAVALTALARSL